MSNARSRILSALETFKPRKVEIPELGGTVYLRPVSVLSLNRIRTRIDGMRDTVAKARAASAAAPDDQGLADSLAAAERNVSEIPDKTTVALLAACLVDEQGERLLAENEEHLLAGAPVGVFEKLMASLEVEFPSALGRQ